MSHIDFELRGDHIPLDALLKAIGVASSGGVAKILVAEGRVFVNGQLELRKTFKVRAGHEVAVGNTRIRVHGGTLPAPLG